MSARHEFLLFRPENIHREQADHDPDVGGTAQGGFSVSLDVRVEGLYSLRWRLAARGGVVRKWEAQILTPGGAAQVYAHSLMTEIGANVLHVVDVWLPQDYRMRLVNAEALADADIVVTQLEALPRALVGFSPLVG